MGKQTKKINEENHLEISKQPVLNIGLIGHVDHGKTTLTKALTGRWTDVHSEEMRRGITIRLGYANASFYKCENCGMYGTKEICDSCKGHCKFSRKVSFVDAPGHETLMATMLSGASIMDAAILLISASEGIQPQSKEHLTAISLLGIKNVIVVQNKIDLVDKETAIKNYKEIKQLLDDYKINAPIIPVSAQHNININKIIEAIEKIPTPVRDPNKDPIFFVARSFDINLPGKDVENLSGGVLGGAVKQGVFKVGDEIEIRPGIYQKKANKEEFIPLKTKIISIRSDKDNLNEAVPGGSVAFATLLDPALVKSDSLMGNVVGLPGRMPAVHQEIDVEVRLLERVVGMKDEIKVDNIKISEPLLINVNSTSTIGMSTNIKENKAEKSFLIHLKLKVPVCANVGDKFTISRMVGNRFRLIGYGELKK